MTESWLKCHRSHEKSEQKHIHRKQWKTCKLSFFMFLLSDLLHDDNWSSGCVTHIGLAMGTQTFGFNRRNVKAVYHQRYDGHQINRHPKDFEQTSLPSWWFQPLWKIWKSVGMIIPNICEKNVPNHQPAYNIWHRFLKSQFFFPQVRPHFPNNLVWVNFITTSLRLSPGIMVNKRNHPQMALIQVGQGPQEVGGLNSGEWIIIIYPDLVMSYIKQQKRVLHAVCHWSLKNGGFPLCSPTKGSAVCLETIPPISWDKFMTLSWNGICVFSNVFKYQSHILFVHHPCFFGPPGLWHEELHAAPDMVHETTPFTTDLKGEEPLRLGGGYPVGTWEIRPFLTLRDCALAKLKSKS